MEIVRKRETVIVARKSVLNCRISDEKIIKEEAHA